MNENKFGHLVKIIKIDNSLRDLSGESRLENNIIGKLGFISYCYVMSNCFDIELEFEGIRKTVFFFNNEVEVLNDEPICNTVYNCLCFWCKGSTIRTRVLNKIFYYCPKCLR